jgi:hypothetical protein
VHAPGLSIGSAEGIERRYRKQLARVLDFVHAPWWRSLVVHARWRPKRQAQNGRIKDTRIIMDTLGLMTQVGALPSAPTP